MTTEGNELIMKQMDFDEINCISLYSALEGESSKTI
jgi:hypothetical protein